MLQSWVWNKDTLFYSFMKDQTCAYVGAEDEIHKSSAIISKFIPLKAKLISP